MAAAYSTGISTSATNLLQLLVTWLSAQGWTIDSSASEGTGWRAHLHKGGQYINFRAAGLEQVWPAAGGKFHDSGHHDDVGTPGNLAKGYGIGFYLGTGYSGASAWNAQAGGPVRTDGSISGSGMNLPAGSVAAYHFFDDGLDNVTVVVERNAGVVCFIGWGPTMFNTGFPEPFWYFFGSSSAFQNTNPGPYFYDYPGTNVTAYPPMSHGEMGTGSLQTAGSMLVHAKAFVRADVATVPGRWLSDGETANVEYGYAGAFLRSSLNANPLTTGRFDEGEFPNYRFLKGRIFQSAYAGALLLPIHCFAETVSGLWTPVGYPPTVFWSEGVGHGYSIGSVYAAGGLNYMIFPGFAVRKAA